MRDIHTAAETHFRFSFPQAFIRCLGIYHRMDHRPPKIAKGMKALLKTVDPEYAMDIACLNTENLLGM